MQLSIIIPVYNSSKIIPSLVKKIKENINKKIKNYEVILINDSSKDNSWNIIKKISKKNKFVKVHSNTFSSNNKLSQFIKKDEKSENKTLQRKLMNSVFLTKSIALQNDEANQKIIEKRSEIEVTQRKLRLINDEKKNNNVHKLQFEIDMLSKNVYSLEQSCVNIIKKIRTKRMA